MTTLTTSDVLLLLALAWSVLIGYGLWAWFDARRSARRYAAANLAFWTSLTAFVDRARANIDALVEEALDEAADAAMVEAVARETRARLRSLSDSEVARRIEAHYDAAVRELRAELDEWESA